jgi:hypothetical protein
MLTILQGQTTFLFMFPHLSGSGVVGFPDSDGEEVDDDTECLMPLNVVKTYNNNSNMKSNVPKIKVTIVGGMLQAMRAVLGEFDQCEQ